MTHCRLGPSDHGVAEHVRPHNALGDLPTASPSFSATRAISRGWALWARVRGIEKTTTLTGTPPVWHTGAVELVGEARRSDAGIDKIGDQFPHVCRQADGADWGVAGMQRSGPKASGAIIRLRGGTARATASGLGEKEKGGPYYGRLCRSGTRNMVKYKNPTAVA